MNKDTLQDLGSNIKKLRKARGYSQEALALLCNMTPSYLGSIERGDQNTTIDTAARIAAALGVTLDCLLAPSGPGAPVDPPLFQRIAVYARELSRLPPEQLNMVLEIISVAIRPKEKL